MVAPERILHLNPEYLQVIEIVSAVLGLISVYLLSIGNGRGWGIGAVMIVLMGVVYWDSSLFGSAGLQLFFLVTQFFGWARWKKGEESDLRSQSKFLSGKMKAVLLLVLSVSWFALAYFLENQGGVAHWPDSFCTTGSMAAQILMVSGFRECWLLWLAVDIVYVGLSFQQHLFAYFVLYIIFCGMAWNGWRQWTRDAEE